MSPWVGLILLMLSLACIIYILPNREKQKNQLAFDHAVLGFVDALYLAGIPMRCSLSEIRRYVTDLLDKSHKLPDNQYLMEHTTPSGQIYCSWTGYQDHARFAVICLARYASDTGNDDLLAWCNANIMEASKLLIHF